MMRNTLYNMFPSNIGRNYLIFESHMKAFEKQHSSLGLVGSFGCVFT
jgi:hypothetical protein